ncbi:MAG TPA: hypothetical protein VFY14_02800, partial [Streptomyces sp.]|nr:hypothetical protein [Streptomyces sp.]
MAFSPPPLVPGPALPPDGTGPTVPSGPTGRVRPVGPVGLGRLGGRADHGGHMVVCGDNSLALRLVRELASVYRQRVTVVLPSLRGGDQGPRIAALVGDPRLDV